MIADVIDSLRCPHCRDQLVVQDGTARCRLGHAFDVAKHGYLNLMAAGSNGTTADTAEMVAARAGFLAAGHYAPIRSALVESAAGRGGLVVEIGAGTGYHLAGVVGARADRVGVALDNSRYAARRAARAHPRIGSVMADAWQGLPVADGAASVVLDVFAPRNAAEIARVLAPDGVLLVVTPNPAHLRQLVGVLGLLRVDEAKQRRLAGSLGSCLIRSSGTVVESSMRLGHAAVRDLVAMGPSAWHVEPADLERRIAGLPGTVTVSASVTISAWRRRAA